MVTGLMSRRIAVNTLTFERQELRPDRSPPLGVTMQARSHILAFRPSRAAGYRSFDRFGQAILFCCGNLDLYPQESRKDR